MIRDFITEVSKLPRFIIDTIKCTDYQPSRKKQFATPLGMSTLSDELWDEIMGHANPGGSWSETEHFLFYTSRTNGESTLTTTGEAGYFQKRAGGKILQHIFSKESWDKDKARAYLTELAEKMLGVRFMGSDTSGHYGHAGDPPNIGGSVPGGGHSAIGLNSETIHFLKENGLSNLIALDGNLDIRALDVSVAKSLGGLENIPRDSLERILSNGGKVVGGIGNATDFEENRHLKGKVPRGWPEDMTWEIAEGVYDTDEKIAYSGTKSMSRIPSKSRLRYVASHEVGHLADSTYSETGELSSSNRFRRLQTKYSSSLDPYQKQPGEAGLRETFADKFSDYFNTSKTNIQLKRDFPDMWDYMKEHFGKGPG